MSKVVFAKDRFLQGKEGQPIVVHVRPDFKFVLMALIAWIIKGKIWVAEYPGE